MTERAALHDHALHNIRYIRETMERASAFTSIPGWGGCAIGVTALVTAAIASRFGLQPRLWVITWVVDAAVAIAIAAATMYTKARRAHVSLASTPARRFFVSYSAPLVAAALITIALVRAGMFTPLPAVWLLLYGASFISSGAFSIRAIPLMGICFMLLGLAACFVPFGIANLIMAAGFGGLHIAFGYIIARSYGG
ncbi:MAG TPA: hypothetical protein VF980_17505 [Thermoanaerobaculia bacterium]